MLGLQALGIETDRHGCATARAAGYERLQDDVAELDPLQFEPAWGLVGSPPCQAYSTAGNGLGRADKPIVIACAHELAAGNDSRRARREGCRDSRSLLTIEPLRYILALRPRWVALEQVPAVLELWTVFARLLAGHGYHTTAGVLSAERYGVPQTRKRAFLIASLDGPVALPAPTHRSYNPRRSAIPDDELALEPWVSMAEALGWAPCERVGFPGRADTPGNRPSKTDTAHGVFRDRRPASRPALTPRKPCVQLPPGAGRGHERGGWAWRNGNQHNSAIRASAEPAPTVHFGHRSNQVEWMPQREQAPTASGRDDTPGWAEERPATTVLCDRRVHPPGHKENESDPPGRYQQRRGANAVRLTVAQAAILQGFPPDYPWQGARTRQFEQVGNAVPPPLARRVLEAATGTSRPHQRQSSSVTPPHRDPTSKRVSATQRGVEGRSA